MDAGVFYTSGLLSLVAILTPGNLLLLQLFLHHLIEMQNRTNCFALRRTGATAEATEATTAKERTIPRSGAFIADVVGIVNYEMQTIEGNEQ